MELKLSDFEGAWEMTRVIEGDLGGRTGRFRGHARFTPEGPCLRYVEEGELELAGVRMTAGQEHLWQAEGLIFHVSFADGRPFHDFDGSVERPAARHDCPPDLYLVEYDFSAWPDWVSEWHVTGPRKDYRVRTAYRRVAVQS